MGSWLEITMKMDYYNRNYCKRRKEDGTAIQD